MEDASMLMNLPFFESSDPAHAVRTTPHFLWSRACRPGMAERADCKDAPGNRADQPPRTTFRDRPEKTSQRLIARASADGADAADAADLASRGPSFAPGGMMTTGHVARLSTPLA